MRVDTYTKAVLTVIAACLLWICARSAGVPLAAQTAAPLLSPLPAQPVVVVGWGRLNPAAAGGVEIDWADAQRRISEISVPVRASSDPRFEPLRVRIENPGPWPVSVDGVRRGAAWDALRTQVEPMPPQRAPGIGLPR